MTDKMLADLAEVSALTDGINNGWLRNSTAKALRFLKEHHATIAQNAEAAKRLKALEQAIEEIGTTGIGDADEINIRADEIMRGGE